MSSAPAIDTQITVQVVYALPHAQYLSSLQVGSDCTAIEAVKQSTLLEQFPELESTSLQLGVFGRVVAHDTKLNEGVRIEIYRPLVLEPKESRRQRALLAKK